MPVYLLCLSRKLAHSKHYMGATRNLSQRIAAHRCGRGAAMLRECNRRGISYSVVRTWPGTFLKEIALKARFKSRDLCPRCSGRSALKRGK